MVSRLRVWVLPLLSSTCWCCFSGGLRPPPAPPPHPISDQMVSVSGATPAPIPKPWPRTQQQAERDLPAGCSAGPCGKRLERQEEVYLGSISQGWGLASQVRWTLSLQPPPGTVLRAHPSSESPEGADCLGSCRELRRAGGEPWAGSLEPLSCAVTLSPCPSLSLTFLQLLGLGHPCAIRPVTQPMQGLFRLFLLIELGPRSQPGERRK